MFVSLFSDELRKDVKEVIPIAAAWGLTHLDFRGFINGKGIERQTDDELRQLRQRMDAYGLKTGVIQSSLCKVHLPDEAQYKKELEKLDGIVRAANILDCRLVRSFNFWQNEAGSPLLGQLAVRPDELAKVMELFAPVAQRARQEGLILGIENCGQTPEEVIAVLEALQQPEWGMAWDVSNLFETLPEAQGDGTDYFVRALTYANMLHVKSRGVLAEIDCKKVPWERVLRGAAATGKHMPVSIETHVPAGCKLSGEEASQKCYQYLKTVWPASAPSDLHTALAAKPRFVRPYENDPVRVVVVGLGMGKTRILQMMETNGIQLVGVCDSNSHRAQEAGEQFNVPYSTELETFLQNPQVEAVYIVTPTGTHAELAEKCLQAGKHVLLTKPMDVSTAHCDRVIALAKAKGLLLGVDFDLHFRGPLTELKQAVKAGWFGNLLAVNIDLSIRRTQQYYDENGGWRGTLEMDGGGAFSNQGIHEIDRVLSILGMPKRVKATIATATHRIEAEDYGVSQWEYDNGCRVRFYVTTSYPLSSWYTRVEVHGTKGAYLLCSGGPEGEHIYWGKEGKWSEAAPYSVPRQWQQGSDNFAYCLRTGEQLVVDGQQGRAAIYVLESLYRSARNGEQWVELESL